MLLAHSELVINDQLTIRVEPRQRTTLVLGEKQLPYATNRSEAQGTPGVLVEINCADLTGAGYTLAAMNENFKPFALIYLNEWYEYDIHFVAGLCRNNSKQVRLQWLQRAASHYRVARNFEKLPDEREAKSTRLEAALRLLDGIRDSVPEASVDCAVGELAQRFRNAYPVKRSKQAKKEGKASTVPTEGLISAASKFLWIRHRIPHQSPIVIYDSNGFEWLKQECGGKLSRKYAAYRQEWLKQFAKREKHIRFACAKLVHVKRFSLAHAKADEELKSLVGNRWFRERVFDRFLWSAAALKSKDLV